MKRFENLNNMTLTEEIQFLSWQANISKLNASNKGYHFRMFLCMIERRLGYHEQFAEENND